MAERLSADSERGHDPMPASGTGHEGAGDHRLVRDHGELWASAADREAVAQLLGRSPRAAFRVAARLADGSPLVIENFPLLDDGTPMPTRFWLVGARARTLVGRLESAGGVDAAEAYVGLAALAEVHARYAAQRDVLLPVEHRGPRPSGGVGGTRLGVKCLHAHYAAFLAGGEDPVGRWVADRLAEDPLQVVGRTARGDPGGGQEAGQ